MASSTTYENTVGGSTKLLYNDTSANDYVVELPKSSGKLISDNTTAYDNDTSTFIANTLASGAIIERGSNANGKYVKYADGTLICTLSATVTDQAITTAYGSLFSGTRTWTFPYVFISPPTCAGSIKWSTSGSWSTVEGSSISSVLFIAIDILSRATGANTYLNFTAIGRWK